MLKLAQRILNKAESEQKMKSAGNYFERFQGF